MVYEIKDASINESPEEYLIAYNSLRKHKGHRLGNGCYSAKHRRAVELEFFSKEYFK